MAGRSPFESLKFSRKEKGMRRTLLALAGVVLLSVSASAQTAEDIVNKYIKTVGGMDKIQAVKTLKRVGKFTGGGGLQTKGVHEKKSPHPGRQGVSLQGMTRIKTSG